MIDISPINLNLKKEIIINENIKYDENDYKNTDIIDISNIVVTGSVKRIDNNDLDLNINAKGVMTLPCSITLKPVKHQISIQLHEIIDEKDENNLKKDQNTLELKPYLWENIVVEIPLRIISDDAYKKEYKGNGWQLITDETKKENKNNPFEALEQLLDDKE